MPSFPFLACFLISIVQTPPFHPPEPPFLNPALPSSQSPPHILQLSFLIISLYLYYLFFILFLVIFSVCPADVVTVPPSSVLLPPLPASAFSSFKPLLLCVSLFSRSPLSPLTSSVHSDKSTVSRFLPLIFNIHFVFMLPPFSHPLLILCSVPHPFFLSHTTAIYYNKLQVISWFFFLVLTFNVHSLPLRP